MNNKKALFSFCAATIGVCVYLIGYNTIAAEVISGSDSGKSDISGQDESVLDLEQAGELEPGENDSDTGDGAAGQDEILSDDRPKAGYPAVLAGNYVWQSLDAGTLGSFGNVDWTAGYEFAPQADAAVTELCGFFDDSEREVGLYDQSFALLAAATIKSDKGWNCVSIPPVDVAKNQTYYVAAKTGNEPLYYKYQCCNPSLLPRTAYGATVKAGVRQTVGKPFGSDLKRYGYLVFGLVDVKVSRRGLVYLPAPAARPVIIDPQPTGTISNSKPLLSVATDKNTTCKYSKTKKNYADMEYSFSTTGKKLHTKRIGPLSDGSYTRVVRCKDAAGNISLAKTITFKVQNGSTANISKPVISNPLPTGTISDDTPAISVTTDENATCKYSVKNVSYNSSSRTAFSATGAISHSSTVGPLNDGNYVYYVRCKDEAGNANISSKKIIFTVATGASDTTPPAISSVKADPASGEAGDTFIVTAKVTDNSGIASVKVQVQHPDGTTLISGELYDDGSHSDGSNGDGVYGRKVTTSGAEEGTYYIDIIATDEYGNSSTKNNGATFTLKAASTSCAPAYEPGKWNVSPVLANNNCYNYANDKITNTFAQPGRASGAMYTSIQCSNVVTAAKADGLTYLGVSASSCTGCRHTVALVVDSGVDYHWYRKDANLMWSHKPGKTKATNVDASGQTISNPSTCDRNYGSTNYTSFCGYFCADKTKTNIQ